MAGDGGSSSTGGELSALTLGLALGLVVGLVIGVWVAAVTNGSIPEFACDASGAVKLGYWYNGFVGGIGIAAVATPIALAVVFVLTLRRADVSGCFGCGSLVFLGLVGLIVGFFLGDLLFPFRC